MAMNRLQVYSTYIARLISGGSMILKGDISSLGLISYSDRFYTHKYVTKVWTVIALPIDFDINLTTAIREEMFERFPDVIVSINMHLVPAQVNVRNDMFKREMSRADREYEAYKQLFEPLPASEKRAGVDIRTASGRIMINKNELNLKKELRDSYNYVFDTVTAGNSMGLLTYFIQASARNKKEIDKFKNGLDDFLTSLNLVYVELKKDISEYLAMATPASPSKVSKYKNMLVSPENVSSMLPCNTLGMIGNRGILLGIDIRSWLPVYQDCYSSPAAQVNVIIGKAGSGKTMMSQEIAIAHNLMGSHGSMIDIKGNEGRKLFKYVKGVEIDMGNPDSPFFNSLRFDDMVGYGLDAGEVYRDAVNTTVAILTIMTNLSENEGNPSDLLKILRMSTIKTLDLAGIYEGKEETYHLTKGLNPYKVIETLSELKKSSSFTGPMVNIANNIINRCSSYLSPEGEYSSSFKNELTLRQALDTEFIVYSLNKADAITLSVVDTVKVYMCVALDSKASLILSTKGINTFALYEEVQRCLKMEVLMDFISSKVTVSRSQGVFVYLLFNVVSVLKSPAMSHIRSNITTKIIGRIEESDIKFLVDELGCGPIKEELKLVSTIENEKFRYSFAVYSDTGTGALKGIVKAVIPDEMESHLRTRSYREEG